MRIELSKNIIVKKLEFVGEVNFFEESPYIKLLEGFSTQDELKEELQKRDLSTTAIRNIIKKLESLGVLEDGDIVSVEDGFPEREYGKYILEMFENDTPLPFKFKNKEIKRESYTSKNRVDNIKEDEYLIERVYQKSKNFSDDKIFQVIKLEGDNYIELNKEDTDLVLNFDSDKWSYTLCNKKTYMKEGISLVNLFRGEWNLNNFALAIEYKWIENDTNAKENFLWSFTVDKYKIKNYGMFNADFKNIPIIPKTKNDAEEWLLYLLKQEIEKKERYISKDELHYLWLNLLDIPIRKQNKPYSIIKA